MKRVTKRHVPVLSDFDEPAGGTTIKRPSVTPDMAIAKHIPSTSPAQSAISFHLVDHGYGATPQHQIMREVPLAPPKTTEAVKRRLNLNMGTSVTVPARPKFRTPKQRSPRGSPAQGSRGGKKVERTRYDTSLGLLTKKFVQLLQNSHDGVVDLNVASTKLEVQKRRIYDITNVLEGIGILEKKSKNNIQWKCGRIGNPDLETLEEEMQSLESKENFLDSLIQSAECELRQLSENKRYAYITYGDLKSIPDFRDKTVIGIKAPPEAQLQVPEPSDTNGYELYMKTEMGEIEVFVCPENTSQNPWPFPPSDPLLQDIKPLLTPVYEDMKQIGSPRFKTRNNAHNVGSAQRNLNESWNMSLRGENGIKLEPGTTQQTVTLPVLTPRSLQTTQGAQDVALNSHSNVSGIDLGQALMSEVDDFGLISGSFQLQTEDHQHTEDLSSAFEPFLSLEPPLGDADYNFSLGTSEGLSDLFDFDF